MSNYYVHKNYTVDSEEGFNVTHFTSWTNAFNASKNGDTITIVADGGQVGYPPKDLYRHVVVESGSTFAFQLRLFKIKDSVTIKAGATFKVLPHGNIINPYTHIDTGELYVGEKGATERATMNFDTNSISTLYSSIWECYNADIIVGDLGAVGKTSFNDSTIEVKGSLSFAAGTQSSTNGGHSLVNSTLTAKGHSLRGDSTYFSAGCNRIAGLTMDNSTITIDDGVDGTVADVVELGVLKSGFLNNKKDLILTNNSKIIVENGTQINLLYNVSLSDSKIEGGNFSIISGNLTMTGKSSLEIAALDIAANQKIVIDNTSTIIANALTGTGTIEINIVDKLSGLDQVIDLADGADTTGLLDRISVKQDGYSAIIKDGDIYVASYLYVGKAPEGTPESDIYTNITDALDAANGRVVQISGRFVDVDQATMTAIENGNVKFAAGTILFLAEGVTTTLTDENLTIKNFGVKAELTDGVVDLATDNAVATGSIGNTDTNIELTTGSATEGTAEVRGEVSGKDVTISNSKDLAITGSVNGSNVVVNNADNAVIDGGSDDYSAKFTADEKITFVNDGHAVVDMSAKNIEVENNSVNTITNSTIGYDENGNVIAETVVIDAKENANGVISASKIGAKNITIADQTVTDSEVNANKTNGTLYLKDANTFNNTDAVANNVWIGFQNTKNDITGSLELENGATVTARTQIVIGENSSLTVDKSSYVETQTDVLQVRGEATFNGGLADGQKVSQELTATAKEDVQANLNYFQIYPTGTMTLEDGACVAVKAYNKIWGNLNIDNSRLEIASGEKSGSWGWLTNPVANNFGGLWIAEGGAVSVDNGSLLAVGGVYRNQGFGLKNEAEITIDNGSKVVVAFNAVNTKEINILNGASIVVGNNFANDTQTAHTDFGFVNDGVINITMDAEDLTDGVDNVYVDAKVINGKGTIIIDATKFAGGVDKVINVSDANDVKIEFKEGTAKDGVELLVNNGDVFVSDVKYDTIYVDANFKGEYGDAVGEGKYFGVNAFANFEDALIIAEKNNAVSRIELLSNCLIDSVINPRTYAFTQSITFASAEGKEYKVEFSSSIPYTGRFSIYTTSNDASITFEENFEITGVSVVANGFGTTNNKMVIDGTITARSLKQWTSDNDILISTTGKVVVGFDDGQFDMAYGNGSVTVNGVLKNTNDDSLTDGPQFKAGYSGTRGNGNALNLNNTYFEAGKEFNFNGTNGTVNVNNSVFKVSGGDYPGVLNMNQTGNSIKLTNGSRLITATVNINADNEISVKDSSLEITKALTNAGTITISNDSLVSITGSITNNNTISISDDSLMTVAGTFTNNGTIEITISDKFIGTKTIIDVNNVPTTEYGTINITGANDVISTKNEDGDLVIYKVDTKTLFVDTAWKELENGAEIATNLVKGVNAFTSVNDAMVVAQEKGGATIVLANIPGASASVTDNTAIWRTNGTYTFTGGDYYNFNSYIQTPKSSEDYKDVDVNIVFDNAKVVVGKFRLDTGSTLTINNTHMDGTSYTGDGRTWLTFYGDSQVTITNSVVGYNTAYNTGNSDAIVAGDKETDYSNIKGMMTFYGSGVMNVTNSTLFGFSAPGNGAVFGVTDKGLFTFTDSALYGGSIAIGIDDNVTVGRDNEVATMILDNSKFTYINGDYVGPYAQKITVGDAKAGKLIVRNNSEIDYTNAEAKEFLVNSNGEVEISNSTVSANSVTNNGAISINGGSLTTDALEMKLPTSVITITNGTIDVGTYTSSNTISQAGTFVVKKGTATDAATIIVDKATTNVFVKGEYGVLKDANIGGILSVRGHLNFTGNTQANAIYLGYEGNTINNLEDMSFNITGTVLTKNTAHGGNKDVIYTINYTDALINSSTVNNINGAKVKYTNSSIISNSEFNAGTFVTFENSYADVVMQIYPLSHNEIDYKTLEVKVDNSTIIDRAGEFGSFAHDSSTAYRASLNIVNDSYYKVTGNGKYGQGCYLLGEDVKVTVNNSAFITVNEMKNNGTIYITGNSAVNGAFTGTGSIVLENANLVEKSFERSYDVLNSNGEVEKVEVNDIVNTSISSNVTAYGTNNISGNTYISSLRLGYEAPQTGSATVNITGSYDGSFIVGNKNTDKSVYTLNIGTQEGEKTIVAKANAGSILNVYANNGAANIVNTTYYMEQLYNRGTVTVSNSDIILTNVNNYIYGRDGGTAKLTLTNSNWDAENNINSDIAIGSSSYNGNAEGSAIVKLNGSTGSAYTVNAYKLGLNNAGSYQISLESTNYTIDVFADTFIGTNASMNLTASTFSSNNLINNGSLTVNGGTLSITTAIQNSGTITLSNTVNGNITIEGTGSTTLSDKAIIADSLNANIAIKGTASLDADAKFTGSIASGALKVTGNGNTLDITDSSNATIIAGENAVLGSDDDEIGNVAIKGETKQTALTVDAKILNGNKITEVALTINGIDEVTNDVEINGNFSLDILKSVIINDVEYQVLSFLGKYYSNATDFNYYFNKVENGIDISSEAVSGNQEDAPLVENQKSFTISQSANLGDAAIEMKKGTTTVTIKKGVDFTIGDIQKSAEGGLNNVTVSNEAKLTVNGTIDRLNNITVGKTASVTMNSAITGTSGNQAIKLGEKSTGNFEDIDLAGGKNTISLGKNATLDALDLENITTLTLADEAKATIKDFVVSELNNTISLGKFANLTVNGNILTSCGDNYEFDANNNVVVNFAGNVGSTIKLGNNAIFGANSVVGLANFTIGNAAEATVKDVYGTTKNNTISVGKAAKLQIGNINLFDGKDTLKTSESAELTTGALTSVETVTIGKYAIANIGNITGVNKLTVTAGGVVSKVEKFTSLTAKDIVATTGNDSINVGKLNLVKFDSINLLEGNDTIKIADQSKFEVTNDVAFGEGKDTLTVGKNSTFIAANVSGAETITFGAASNIEITGVISDVNKLTIANNLKNSTSTIKTGDVTFADVKASLNIGNLNNVNMGDITFGNNNDTLKIGNDSYVTAGDVIFGEGKNTLDLGKNATFVVDTISGITNFKAATYSLLIVNNGAEDVVFDKEMTGNWSKASIADYQGDITEGNITGSVYNNEFDAFTLYLDKGEQFVISNWSSETDIYISKYDATTDTWGEWSNDLTNIETGLLLDQAGKYAIGVVVSDSQFGKEPLEKREYHFDAKLLA